MYHLIRFPQLLSSHGKLSQQNSRFSVDVRIEAFLCVSQPVSPS